MRGSELVTGIGQSRKGHICFQFKDTRIRGQLMPSGKLLVSWHTEEEKRKYYPVLETVLAAGDDEPLQINPLFGQFGVSYPPPNDFSLLWCRKAVRYVRAKLTMWPFLVIALLVFVYSIFSVAELDYSLQLLNQTILNPFRSMFSPVIFVFLWLFVSFLVMKEWRKSQTGI